MAHFLEHLVFKGGEKYPHYRDVNETAERLAEMLREAGFGDVKFKLMGGSIVALHTGAAE